MTYLLRRRGFLHLKVRSSARAERGRHRRAGPRGERRAPRGGRAGVDPSSDRDAGVRVIRQRGVDQGGFVCGVARIGRDACDPLSSWTPRERNGSRRTGSTPGCPFRLDIVEAPFRDLTVPILEEIRRHTETSGHDRERRDPGVGRAPHPWHLFLHNQTALFVKRLLLFEERAVLTSVPFPIQGPRPAGPPSRTPVSAGSSADLSRRAAGGVLPVVDWLCPPLVEPPKTGRTRDHVATLPFPVP